ncbi:hypothetical protein K469DRAFT_702246 [Zopfia rhizophila CBS 207.26]|uniref:Uncharacterized protein n=1 Tax=Zopfia rhizophila CBS 207.26 TaxID=1314779 RepID=A0A6A6D8M1_9PEZI|nr:hypothetical protein K469DRAFT_702246 [Zopfia rhizophila CBS 207.26]
MASTARTIFSSDGPKTGKPENFAGKGRQLSTNSEPGSGRETPDESAEDLVDTKHTAGYFQKGNNLNSNILRDRVNQHINGSATFGTPASTSNAQRERPNPPQGRLRSSIPVKSLSRPDRDTAVPPAQSTRQRPPKTRPYLHSSDNLKTTAVNRTASTQLGDNHYSNVLNDDVVQTIGRDLNFC